MTICILKISYTQFDLYSRVHHHQFSKTQSPRLLVPNCSVEYFDESVPRNEHDVDFCRLQLVFHVSGAAASRSLPIDPIFPRSRD